MILLADIGRKVLMAALAIALSILVAIAVFVAAADSGRAEEMPAASQLDMVRYDPPEWAKGLIDECWYMEDRKTNSAGWVIKIDGDWLVLPVRSQTEMG